MDVVYLLLDLPTSITRAPTIDNGRLAIVRL